MNDQWSATRCTVPATLTIHNVFITRQTFAAIVTWNWWFENPIDSIYGFSLTALIDRMYTGYRWQKLEDVACDGCDGASRCRCLLFDMALRHPASKCNNRTGTARNHITTIQIIQIEKSGWDCYGINTVDTSTGRCTYMINSYRSSTTGTHVSKHVVQEEREDRIWWTGWICRSGWILQEYNHRSSSSSSASSSTSNHHHDNYPKFGTRWTDPSYR